MTFLATLAVLSLATNLALGIALAYVLTRRRRVAAAKRRAEAATQVIPRTPKAPPARNRGAVALPAAAGPPVQPAPAPSYTVQRSPLARPTWAD